MQAHHTQVSTPKKLGRIAVQAEEVESPKIVVIQLNVSMSLRLQRWLG